MSRAYAIEAACFVIVSAPWLPPELRVKYDKEGYGGMRNAHWGFIGGSGVINPVGEYIAGPLMDSDGIVYAEIDLKDIIRRKCYIDPVGKDSRWDVIRLDTAEGHFAPYTTGFPKTKKEKEQNERSSEEQSLSQLKSQVRSLTQEIAKLKARK